MPRALQRTIFLIFFYVVAPLAVVVFTYSTLSDYLLAPLDPQTSSTSIFTIAPQARFRDVARELEEKNFIKHQLAIRLIAKFQKKDTRIMAGDYEFSPSMSPQEILDAMVDGRMILNQVTIKEGATLRDIARALGEAHIVSPLSFEAALRDPALREELRVPATSFEGYLFPETYRIQRDTPAKRVVQTLRAQLDKVWDPAWDARLIELELTKHAILTLASIIEKESGNAEEQPLVSSVFHNRLKRGMRLQSDPTVIYGIPNFNGNLTKVDLQTPTPYNTYVIPGLPPGPIASPGLTAIKAALFPIESNYLYFVGNGKGKHVFSQTLEQHNEAVNIFQRGFDPSMPSPQPVAEPDPSQQPAPAAVP